MSPRRADARSRAAGPRSPLRRSRTRNKHRVSPWGVIGMGSPRGPFSRRHFRIAAGTLLVASCSAATSASAQVLIAEPDSGVAGETSVNIRGSGWAERDPLCHYDFHIESLRSVGDLEAAVGGVTAIAFGIAYCFARAGIRGGNVTFWRSVVALAPRILLDGVPLPVHQGARAHRRWSATHRTLGSARLHDVGAHRSQHRAVPPVPESRGARRGRRDRSAPWDRPLAAAGLHPAAAPGRTGPERLNRQSTAARGPAAAAGASYAAYNIRQHHPSS